MEDAVQKNEGLRDDIETKQTDLKNYINEEKHLISNNISMKEKLGRLRKQSEMKKEELENKLREKTQEKDKVIETLEQKENCTTCST